MNILMVFIEDGKHYRYALIPSEELKDYDLDQIDDLYCRFGMTDPVQFCKKFDFKLKPLKEEVARVESEIVRITHFSSLTQETYEMILENKYHLQVYELFKRMKNGEFEAPSMPCTFDRIIQIGMC